MPHFAVYDFSTGQVARLVASHSREAAYRKAERIAEHEGPGFVFDDACSHRLPFATCPASHAQE